MNRDRTTFICGEDFSTLEPRDPCPNPLHDWPLPAGFVSASMMAESRLEQGWGNTSCPDCREYGWVPGRFDGYAAAAIEVKP
ncbi:hypothetical protein [Nocardia aurea]|uniref:hypothetical protein n=1 Tax=Nocardia aurea TaxID=2144174 RepID=UPI0033B3F134